MMEKAQILLTNDDGIQSPGLWAAAEALSEVGYVHVIAPREQSSGAGRSLPSTSDGKITSQTMQVHGKQWTVYAVGGTPAQSVLHGILEVIGSHPALVVSGINYGENVATGVTGSGTVGAALEAASLGIPALAISLQTPPNYHLSYSKDIDFSAAAYFTKYFSQRLISKTMPEDVFVLNVNVPADATQVTPWEITRLARTRYYQPVKPERTSWDQKGVVGYKLSVDPHEMPADTDIYAIQVKKIVSVTPLSIDLTSRADPALITTALS